MFFSFTDSYPGSDEFDKSVWYYPNRADHIYKFQKPKVFDSFFYISMRSCIYIKVEIKISFNDLKLEKFRTKYSEN